jgi:hypothetical protein
MTLDTQQRLRWSAWSRCESSFSLWLVPNLPGVFVLGEEVIAPGETGALGGRRMLAVLRIQAAEDLGRAISRLFVAAGPIRERLQSANCFIRYAVVTDDAEREAVRAALENWLVGAEAASASSGLLHPAEGVAEGVTPVHLPVGF